MSVRSALKRWRDLPGISKGLCRVARPVEAVARRLSSEIRAKVRLNGGTVTYDGIPLRFPEGVGVIYSSMIFWEGVQGYEPTTWRVLKFLASSHDQFLDVGSNIGLYAVLTRKINPALRVDAFEPIPLIHAHNVEFHRINGLDADRVHPLALSDRDGEAEMALPILSDANPDEPTATLREDSWQSCSSQVERIRVRTMTLDTFMRSRTGAGNLCLKIDVEDFEAAVLRGAMETLKSMRPLIVCEILPRQHGNREVLEELDRANYLTFGVTREGLIRMEREDFCAERSFTDFLCAPAERCPSGRSRLSYSELGRLLARP